MPGGGRACRSRCAPRRRCGPAWPWEPPAGRWSAAIPARRAQSSEEAAAVEARLPLLRDADDEVVAGHVREATEVRHVAELLPAGRMSLVAAGRDLERIAHDDRLRRPLPEVELRAAADPAVDLDLDREPGIRAARPDELAAGAPAIRK